MAISDCTAPSCKFVGDTGSLDGSGALAETAQKKDVIDGGANLLEQFAEKTELLLATEEVPRVVEEDAANPVFSEGKVDADDGLVASLRRQRGGEVAGKAAQTVAFPVESGSGPGSGFLLGVPDHGGGFEKVFFAVKYGSVQPAERAALGEGSGGHAEAFIFQCGHAHAAGAVELAQVAQDSLQCGGHAGLDAGSTEHGSDQGFFSAQLFLLLAEIAKQHSHNP